MNTEEVYEAVRTGNMSLEEFQNWVIDVGHDAYCEGAGIANYENEKGDI